MAKKNKVIAKQNRAMTKLFNEIKKKNSEPLKKFNNS